jgi:serine/threonine protein kinase/WD40 repeat protein
MSHPPLAELLAGAPAALAHAGACDACSGLVALATPLTAPDGLPVVDDALYRDREPLADGQGGMGKAYLATDVRLGRVVVVKEPLSADELGGDRALATRLSRRFEREARLTARLEHPAIVTVHEAGQWPSGVPFYAMRRVDGTPLDAEIARRATLVDRLALLPSIVAVADALAYSHDRGVVHRDVKPANVVLGPFGETVLLDWGLAREIAGASPDAADVDARAESRGGLTRIGAGTPAYMSPEQARGEAADVRMDVYSLGATLRHLLTGEPPYGVADASTTRRRLLSGPPEPLATRAPDVPSELAGIVERAMARDAGARMATARELSDELRRFQAGQLLASHRYTPRELVSRWMRENAVALRVSAAAISLLVGLGVFASVRIVRERDRAESSERSARRELARSRGTIATRLSDEPRSRIDALVAALDATRGDGPPPDEARQGLFDAISAGPVSRTFSFGAGGVYSMDGDARGERVAFSTVARALRVVDVRTGAVLGAWTSGHQVSPTVRISPTGRRIAAVGFTRRAEAWTVGSDVPEVVEASVTIAGAALLPDDAWVTAADALVVRSEGGRERARLALPAPATVMTTSRDGAHVVAGTLSGHVVDWQPALGASRVVAAHDGEVVGVAYDDAGGRVLSAGRDGRVLSHPPGGGAPSVVLSRPGTRWDTGIGLSPDGRRAWLTDATRLSPDSYSIEVLELDGGPRRTVSGTAMAPLDDTRSLWTGTSAAGIVRSRDGALLVPLLGPALQLRRLRAALAGTRVVATSTPDDDAAIFDVRPGRDTGLVVGAAREIVALAPAGHAGLVGVSLDRTARVWDASTGLGRAMFEAGSELTSLAVDDRSELAIAGGLDGATYVFSTASGALVRRLEGTSPIAAVAARGGKAATCASSGAVVTWDVATGERLGTRGGPEGAACTALSWSTDGVSLYAGFSDGRTLIFPGPGEAPRALDALEPEPTGIASIVTSPSGALLVSTPTGTSALVDATTLVRRATLPGRAVSTSPFSPDGSRVLLASPDGGAFDLEIATGRRTVVPGGAVLAAIATRDRRTLLAGDDAGLLHVVVDGVPVATLRARGLGPITALALSPDESHVFAAHATGAMRMHPITVEGARARACGILEALGRPADQCASSRTSRTETKER